MHFSGVIECIILLDRLKTFSPFIKRAFTISPKKITFILLCVCLFIDFFPIFQYSAYEYDYYYYTSDGQVSMYKVYFSLASAIAGTYFGSIIEIAVFVIRDGVTLAFSISLNIICFIQMKNHIVKKQSLSVSYKNAANKETSRAVTHVIDLTKK